MKPDCWALNIIYATAATATAGEREPAAWGDYNERISSISMSLNGAAPVEVARYKFDTTGGPRPGVRPAAGLHWQRPCGDPLYWYTSENRVLGYIPPAEETWNFNYDSYGRLISSPGLVIRPGHMMIATS